MSFVAETEFSGKKEEFLSRDVNKHRLIWKISDKLSGRDNTVIKAFGDADGRDNTVIKAFWDADVDIVKAAVGAAFLLATTLIGEDIDLLVLLLCYAQRYRRDLYFRAYKYKYCGTFKLYDINSLKEIIGHDMCSKFNFIHAVTSSDTTSGMFCVKKTAVQKPVKEDHSLFQTRDD